jgi:hypothetical protein
MGKIQHNSNVSGPSRRPVTQGKTYDPFLEMSVAEIRRLLEPELRRRRLEHAKRLAADRSHWANNDPALYVREQPILESISELRKRKGDVVKYRDIWALYHEKVVKERIPEPISRASVYLWLKKNYRTVKFEGVLACRVAPHVLKN